jgi:hypothetical protein
MEKLLAWVKTHVVWQGGMTGELDIQYVPGKDGWEAHIKPVKYVPATIMLSLISTAFEQPLITGSFGTDSVQVSGQYGAVKVYLIFHFSRLPHEPSPN